LLFPFISLAAQHGGFPQREINKWVPVTDLSGGILYKAVSPRFCSLRTSLEMESERDHLSIFGNKLEDVLSTHWRREGKVKGKEARRGRKNGGRRREGRREGEGREEGRGGKRGEEGREERRGGEEKEEEGWGRGGKERGRR